LTVENLHKYFPVKRGLLKRTLGHIKAVDNVSFTVGAGECLGIVGESGCGKTTLVRTLLGLIKADQGHILFPHEGGHLDVVHANHKQLLALRRQVQMVFQDPFSSLDPRMTVFEIVAEPLHAQRIPPQRLRQRVPEVLIQAGLQPAYARRYPHQLSGGERQRVGIARALAIEPTVLLLDEPVSALDVSVRAQILNLLLRLQQEMNLTYIFITHDLSVVKHLSDRIAVMYLGQIVELGETRRIFQKPAHPYTDALIASAPFIDPERQRERFVIKGDVPSPMNPPPGCHFSSRCFYVQDICHHQAPELRLLADERLVRCHFAEELDLGGVVGTPISAGDVDDGSHGPGSQAMQTQRS
jgi:oligopeptide/dipeptide ABC transporter ATP-binding protein